MSGDQQQQQQQPSEEPKPSASATYEAGCHCGHIALAVTLSPPLPEYKVLNCNCSICRRSGYLLVYPEKKDVAWRGNSRERCAVYRFNTREKDQLFCPRCGTSIGIDFRDFYKHGRHGRPPMELYGISVRTFKDIDLDALQYKKFDGVNVIKPVGDFIGQWHEEEGDEKAGEAVAKQEAVNSGLEKSEAAPEAAAKEAVGKDEASLAEATKQLHVS